MKWRPWPTRSTASAKTESGTYTPYTAKGKSVAELRDDYEQHRMDAYQKGNTMEYLHAVLMARAAEDQQRWAVVAAIAACLSVGISVAALIVAVA